MLHWNFQFKCSTVGYYLISICLCSLSLMPKVLVLNDTNYFPFLYFTIVSKQQHTHISLKIPSTLPTKWTLYWKQCVRVFFLVLCDLKVILLEWPTWGTFSLCDYACQLDTCWGSFILSTLCWNCFSISLFSYIIM